MAQKICLFTAHSPQTGGGAVILRSLVKHLPEFSIEWKYLALKPANGYEQGYMGNGIMGSSLIKDILGTWQMLTGSRVSKIDEVVNKLLATDCDAYWVVSHNEGLRVAIELSRLQKKRPVHLTVHDDWAGALSARSVRYRFMAGLAKKMTINALQQVSGVDLISRGMQAYYHQLSNRKGEICHRYLPSDSINPSTNPAKSKDGALNIGHIGSIYDKTDFIRFIQLLQEFEKLKGIKVTVNMWGYHPRKNDIPPEYFDIIKMHKDLPEEKAIPELAKSDFVYSMYPFTKKLAIFGQTSLPTKLTSYVQACRPIFGHGPVDSTLSEFLQNTATGLLWSGSNKAEGLELLEKISRLSPGISNWQKAREDYFGEKNLEVMRKAFS